MSQRPAIAEPILLDDAVRLRPADALDRGTGDLDVIARAELRLLPRPSLALVADDAPVRFDPFDETWTLVQPKTTAEERSFFATWQQPSPSSRLEDKLRQLDVTFAATGHGATNRPSGDGSREPSRWNLVLAPRREPILVERRREAARRLELEILNFPVFGGDEATRAVRLPDGFFRIGHLALEAAPWRIEFTEKPGPGSIRKELDASRGFAPTHEARIERPDGAPIEQDEARQLLEALDRFLSFARGLGCATGTVRAFSEDGAIVWEQWGCRQVAPWRRDDPDSWFDAKHGKTLSEALTRFLHAWKACSQKQAALREAIYWYVTGHWENSRVDGGLILLQAAMERLAHTFYRPRRGNTAPWLQEALCHAGIPLETPAGLDALRTFADGKDAVAAVTKARNNAVHSNKEVGAGELLYWEAWTLARWIVELMVLNAIGYQGCYSNRLREGRIERVPWARARQPQPATPPDGA